VAEQARRAGIERVLVVDWDVHHGNGTQDIFYGRDDVLTCSLHMDHGSWGPSHPQTGRPDETGQGPGRDFNLNVPLPLGAGDGAYLRAIDEVVAPAARSFRPGLIVASSGQDAGAFDPNGRHNMSMAGFHGIGQRLAALADECCDGRLVGVQEGGYQPSHAAYCLLATLEGLLGVDPTPDPLAYVPDQQLGVEEALGEAKNVLTELRRRLGVED
jgi:acetoin utilization deacetylase AcuC-like enzyme